MSSRTMLETLSCVSVLALSTFGCATAPRETAVDRSGRSIVALAGDGTLAPVPHRMSDVLTSTEIAAQSTFATAFDAIERLRPWYLHQRSFRSVTTPGSYVSPAVFVDGAFQGAIEILRTIPIYAVLEVQFLRPLDAIHRFGPDYQAGIILIRSKK